MLNAIHRPSLTLILALSALLYACGGGPAAPTTVEGETSSSAETSAATGDLFTSETDYPSIELLTESSGVGAKPQFSWSPVEGAATYALSLYNQSGEVYWAWIGTSATVYLGGSSSAPDPNSEGPKLLEAMTWAVIALDSDGGLLAASALQPIAP